ncbi:hypothetical protein AMTR_s00100p00125240 [Amborella trichopoda]|uniref:Phytocyanin domain-containing protein n=1 Tax=Amborella trichopoda TaxID=13333 RepID=W1NYR4_AMBTC|nr:hypothetical protein AMTR_s00100p00125240 [Amborella trichopoda]
MKKVRRIPKSSSSSSSSLSLLLWLSLFLLLERAVELDAAVYTVGDEDGWTTGHNYLLWSKKHNFSVGDTLGTLPQSLLYDSIQFNLDSVGRHSFISFLSFFFFVSFKFSVMSRGSTTHGK